MTAITAENTVAPAFKNIGAEGYSVDVDVAATTAIYKWSFVGLSATGYLTSYVAPVAAATATGAAASGTSFLGVALENIASQTSDGDVTCRVQIGGFFEYTLASVAVTELGSPVYAIDNSTLSSTAASARAGAFVGHIVSIASGLATVQLGSLQERAMGKMLTVVSPVVDYATVNHKVLLAHESENPSGMLLATCCLFTTEVSDASNTAGIITIQHTADTTLGCTLTQVDNMAAGDVVVGAGGTLWNPAAASDDALVLIPAGKQVNAEVTTAADSGTVETGGGIIAATFIRV